MSLARLATALHAGELSPRQAVERCLGRIEAVDPKVNSYIAVRADEALAEADALLRSDERGPLWGVPVALKDVIDVAGMPTTAASRVLADRMPAEDAHVVARLRQAGAVVVGKLNLHEFAYGALSTSPHFGPVRNPWSPERISGGSSGGNGAAVAAGLAAGTLGTDTAGSIRIPSCHCGATGLRPSTGRVSNRGVVPVAPSFDTVGPIARTAEDCALLLAAVAGHDPGDPTSLEAPVPPYGELLGEGVRGLRVGVVTSLVEGADPRVAEAVEAALAELGSLGAQLVPVDVPLLEHAGTIQQAMQFPEATDVHMEWLRTRLSDYGADVRARLLVGLYVSPDVREAGRRAREVACDEMRRLLERVDLLAAPTMPVLPPPIGSETVELQGRETLYRLALIPYNSPWSLVGSPVASVPCGLVDGLPVGLALVGPRLGEATVLGAAHAFQQATDWHERRPGLVSPGGERAAPR
ncbi:MAG TPA: amidase [Gaiellaceae bacterium]|nr:amidase [Gaiellaceae bacterium]